MQHSQKSRLDLSSHCFQHLLELIILYNVQYQCPVNIHSLDVFKISSSLVREELLLEDGDDS